MSKILQGTTPSIRVPISTNDFLVTDVVALEWVLVNNQSRTKKGLSDVTVDSEDNSITYTFSEAETLALNPNYPLNYQLRFKFLDGSIVGTNQMSVGVADLYSEEVIDG